MTYVIQSASYANGEETAAVLMTEGSGLVLISLADTPNDWAELLGSGVQIGAYAHPTPQAYRLFKSVFIARLDEEENEPEVMEATLAAAPAKLRLLFNSVEYFVSDDPLFADLHTAVAAALGATRADELLAE